ncbi:MAG: hypothetical protein ISN28_05390, partial [Ectothiorhodospiraceae bacterium AqS1]|nr:hypothetical protein [Ectothiorhodospiraceae bacterium AqS1]
RLRIEEESDGLFDVRLSAVPKKTISVLITKTRFGIGLSRDSMTFTPSNWDEAQSVKISAHADSDKNDSAHFVTFAFEGKRIIREVLVADNDKELPRTQALALPPVGSGDEATLRIQCKQAKPCSVALECSTQVGGLVLEGSLPEPIPAFGTVSLTSIEIQRYTGGNSWAGRGRLGCTLRSSARIGSQVWTRSGDGVLVNNSAMIRSMMEGDVHRADIESIPSPDAFDESNIRIRCNSDSGHCEDTAFACYTDDGTSYTWELGRIDRRTTRHLQSQELAEGIGHRWEDLGLSCELRSGGKFTVQVLTRTGGGGALVNNSATGER